MIKIMSGEYSSQAITWPYESVIENRNITYLTEYTFATIRLIEKPKLLSLLLLSLQQHSGRGTYHHPLSVRKTSLKFLQLIAPVVYIDTSGSTLIGSGLPSSNFRDMVFWWGRSISDILPSCYAAAAVLCSGAVTSRLAVCVVNTGLKGALETRAQPHHVNAHVQLSRHNGCTGRVQGSKFDPVYTWRYLCYNVTQVT